MKTKQAKEESDKSIDEKPAVESKKRGRKKAGDNNDDKNNPAPEEPKTSKQIKKPVGKPKTVAKKKPLGIRKALRTRKAAQLSKEKVKNVVKQTVTRAQKAAIKTEPEDPQEKESGPLIPPSEIKKEPVDETTPTSRSSSPRTAGRRQRLSSDMIMMKSVLADTPNNLVVGPRTSPYSMRKERSNSPSLFEGKSLRSGSSRKLKNNLLNEVVMKEQKKRRRLLSDSKSTEGLETTEDCKKLKRGRSCSQDGSEISKCSDITESDISLSETLNETDIKDFNKKLDKPKTDLDIDIENNVQISPIEKVPSLNVDIKLAETKSDTDPSCNTNEKKKTKLSLKRSTSLDSDNNNSNRLKLGNLNSSDAEDKSPAKTENDTLFEARSSILTSMSKTFNSKEVSKNIRKARRGRKAATTPRASVSAAAKTETSFDDLDKLLQSVFDEEIDDESSLDSTNKKALGSEAATTPRPSASPAAKTSTVTSDAVEEKPETLETLTKELDDLMSKDIDNIIKNLDQNIDRDHEVTNQSTAENADQVQTKTVPKLYSSKPLGDNNSIVAPDTPVKDKDGSVTNDNTPSKTDDSENIRLHYEEDSLDKTDGKQEKVYKSSNVASIDLLMDRLKEFEEFDKRRQRQESESRSSDSKPVMVTNDVVLIPKSGDIKPLKDIQTVRSPEKPLEKENVLSCFENNSAISIVKRDPGPRKSVDIDLPNSVTLIKRNSISARKESTSSNHSKESDAISIFEKSLGKDVTLTEIRKSVDRLPSTPTSAASVDLHQFATIQPTNSSHAILIDSNQISITPRNMSESKIGSNVQVTKRPSRSSRESLSRKSSESGNDNEEKMATIEKIKSPVQQVKSPAISITPAPVAVKSPEAQRMETEALAPPLENVKEIPEDITLTSEVPKVPEASINPAVSTEETVNAEIETPVTSIKAQIAPIQVDDTKAEVEKIEAKEPESKAEVPEKMEVDPEPETKIEAKAKPATETKSPETTSPAKAKLETEAKAETTSESKSKPETEVKPETKPEAKATEAKPEIAKATRGSKSARNSIESQPGPSNALHETPESQKRKENVLRTLGLLTHKAAKEAKIEKLKEKERIYSGLMNNKNKVAKSGDYTGTLKTVIKLNRGVGDREKKKYRSSLKMTFQKSKHRGRPPLEDGAEGQDDAFYTIERREGGAGATSDGGHRKSHYSNRLNNHDTEAAPEPVEPKETLNLVIPEKASSFSIHPGRLCQDQCFYCGGKFGLFDTPCHIAQMKSADRQKKVLDNEEKLTIDSCLCDACYRHVDRRANCPSYRKRPPGPFKQATHPQPLNSQLHKAPPPQSTDKPPSPPIEEESEPDSPPTLAPPPARSALCHTEGCTVVADCSIRRKWLIKMRASVNKILKLEGDYPGLHTIPLCTEHHKLLSPLMSCALCQRRHKHHNLHQLATYEEVNPLILAASIPVQFSERPILCKMCRYFCSLLQGHKQNDKFKHSFRRKLLQIHNVELPPESENYQEVETNQTEDPSSKQKKKVKNKSKQRKSDDQKPESESSDKTESSPEKKEEAQILHPLEEDIESLISSNKIPVPGAKPQETPQQSDSSENDNVYEFEPSLPLDKQTELQYLLQKQNNPAQFLQKNANLTQKQRSLNKLQNASGIQKPGQQQKVYDMNAKRIQKLGQIIAHKDKPSSDSEMTDPDKAKEGVSIFQNIPLNDECTIESIPNKRPADINTLKNKWQMSESFSQVKKNLSELSKKFTVEKDPKKTNECKYSNPVKRLETNPSISVRELFPGEEEMNLQCNIEFSSVKGVTPEGWEKCNSLIQYDVETKKLWTELQRPYGNQSSFLRHLILLEKYFRSGDLVLSHNASPHAANYSDSIQSRLRAYDNVVNDTPRRSEPAINLIEYRKPKHSVNGKSLLKTSHSEDKESKKFMPPPGALPKKKSDKSKSKPLPPELIAINASNNPGRAIQNVLHNIQQLVKGVSASDPTEVASAPVPPVPPAPAVPLAPPQPAKRPPEPEGPKEKKEEKPKEAKSKKPTSKPWRPTLMPITPENVLRTASEPTQVAVDGRQLPSLVQVMSSGKRYHITIQDYNKMCIMRREKLQQLKEGEKTKKQEDSSTVVTEIQPSAMLGNGGSVTQNIPNVKENKPKEMPELSQISTNAATILKNVGLKNITIAPIPQKTATITSQTVSSPIATSPSLLVTSTPIKLPQLGPAVSITSETVFTPNLQNLPIMTSTMVMPRIPKSLTVIPQTVVSSIPQNVLPQNMIVPQAMMVPNTLMLQHPVATTAQIAETRP